MLLKNDIDNLKKTVNSEILTDSAELYCYAEDSANTNKDLELDKAKFTEEIKGLNEQLEVLNVQIKEITDKEYVMNSYHVDVKEPIDPFDKLRIEAQYQKLSPGGYISYIETMNLENNIPAILEIIKFIYNIICSNSKIFH